jgi:UDP-glucose 4-epimerase
MPKILVTGGAGYIGSITTLAPRRDGDAAELVADSRKARRVLGREPKRSGLREIVQDACESFNQ